MAYAIRETSWDMKHTMQDGTKVPIKYPHIEVEYPADTDAYGYYNSAILRGGICRALEAADVPETEIAKYKSETQEVDFDTFDDITNCWVFMVDDVDA